MLREGHIAWSAEAKSKFQQWLNLHRLQWAQEGADADEVEEDVWNHLSVRFSAHDGAVTTSDLRQALESMGLPPLDQAGVSHNIVLENRVVEPPKRGLLVRMGIALVTRPFWVLLWPLLVVLLDTLWGISEGMYVKPFNSWSQWLLVSVAFIAGIYHFRKNQKKGAEEAPLHTVLRHIGLSVAGYYSLIYLPLIVLGTAAFFMGAMYTIGLGLLLLPVYVVCVLIAGAPLLLFSGLVQRKGRKISKSNAILGLL